MAGLRRHGAEGVSTAGGEGVNTDEQHVDQQRPGVAVVQEVHLGAERAETPHKVPATGNQSPTRDQRPFQSGQVARVWWEKKL